MSGPSLLTRVRLLLAGLSPSATSVTPIVGDDRYRVATSVYRFIGQRAAAAEVLELGCGTGFGCAALRGHGAKRVAGVERWPRLTRHARRRYGGEEMRFETAPLEKPPALGSFDLAIALMVLGQSADAEAVLLALRHALREGGRAIVTVPLLRDVEEIDAASRAGTRNALYPWYWAGMLREHFGEVHAFRHEAGVACFPDPSSRAPSLLRDGDFTFVPVPSPERLVDSAGLAAVFEATQPH